jgi:hypothetical protein
LFSTKTTTTAADNNEPEILLYQRKTNPSLTLMRSGFFCSAAHTAYWIWYTTDFIPTVNAAALHDLHVDPAVGVAGICFAAALQTAFMIYPKRLVSKLSYRPRSQKIMVYTHRFPLMRPSLFPAASFPVGTQNERVKTQQTVSDEANTKDKIDKTQIKYLKLNPSSPEAVQIVSEFKGDVTQYRGHLQVGQSWPRYAIDIRSALDVPEPELLLEALLRPEYFSPKDYRYAAISGGDNNKRSSDDADDEEEYGSLGRRFQPNSRKKKRPGKSNRRKR